jgi:hypothetical protein
MNGSGHHLTVDWLPIKPQPVHHQLQQGSQAPPGISTRWSMGIGQSRWGAPIDPFRGGFPVVPVETPPRAGPMFRSAGRKPFQNFRKMGPAAPKFRPVDELASPELQWCRLYAIVLGSLCGRGEEVQCIQAAGHGFFGWARHVMGYIRGRCEERESVLLVF